MNIFNLYNSRIDNNGIKPNEVWTNEITDRFKEYMYNSPTFYQITKYQNDEKIDCTIQDVRFNSTNNGDDKLLCVQMSEDLNIGDVIKWRNLYYILFFEEINSIQSHRSFIIKQCNNLLTFKYENNIVKIPCVLTNGTLYSDGIEIKTIIMSDDKRSIIVPYNKLTKSIKLQQRFMFNKNSILSVSQIDDYTFKNINNNYGLLQMTLIREQKRNALDDVENNLADNSHLRKEVPIILQIDNKAIQIKINKPYNLNPKLLQNNKEINNKEELNKIKIEIGNKNILKLENNNLIGIKNGDTFINITYEKQCISIPIQIVQENINSSNCNIIGSDFIKIGKIGMWESELYDDYGNKFDGAVNWSIVNNDNFVEIKSIENNKITLLALRNQENINKKFTIKCKSLDGILKDSKEIVIKNII